LDVDMLSDAGMRSLMLDEPRLMRRPVLKAGRHILLGFDEAEWREALG
jgi:arsenate reductase-like glutaredoxin family protein